MATPTWPLAPGLASRAISSVTLRQAPGTLSPPRDAITDWTVAMVVLSLVTTNTFPVLIVRFPVSPHPVLGSLYLFV